MYTHTHTHFRKNNGITLVALVITIIILILLIGITISTITNSGLFDKTKEAKNEIIKSEINQKNILNEYEAQISSSRENAKNVEDYTKDLIFRLNPENLENESGITVNGSGISVSSDKKYISSDGNSYINVENDKIDPNSIYRNQSDVTMCCWYRSEKLKANENIILMLGENNVNLVYNNHYLLQYPNIVGAIQGNNTCSRQIDPENYLDGNWHFIAGTWKDNNKVQLYYDGVPFMNTGTYTTSNSYLNIGGSIDERFFIGDISDVRIYGTALTLDNLKQIYEYGKEYLEI